MSAESFRRSAVSAIQDIHPHLAQYSDAYIEHIVLNIGPPRLKVQEAVDVSWVKVTEEEQSWRAQSA